MEAMHAAFFIIITVHLTYTTGVNKSELYPFYCTLFDLEDYKKQVNISNPLDRQVHIGILDASDCFVNMTELYTQFIQEQNKTTKKRTQKERMMISLRFNCHLGITIHFQEFTIINNDSDKADFDILLAFVKCSVVINEVNVFLEIGNIIMLKNTKNLIRADSKTNCQFASNLKAIHIEADCEQSYKMNLSFWELCQQDFPNMILLTIIGCQNNYHQISVRSLQQRFPNLDSLVLDSVITDQPIQFPWRKPELIHDINMNNILKAYFDTMKNIYFYNMFPRNSILLIRSQMDTRSLHLQGEIDMLALTEMGLTHVDKTLLQNVIINQTLNLSKNKLETINDGLLKHQDKLIELYLQWNELTFISSSMFAGLKQLRYINLGYNNIRIIEDDPFKSLYQLKEILLLNNSITQIPKDMFRDQTNSLEILELNYNRGISDIPLWPVYSTRLTAMDLRYSNITGDSIVRLLNHLNKLDVNEKLVDGGIDPDSLPLGNIGSISLGFNNIKTIPSDKMTGHLIINLRYLFVNYQIGVEGNPLTCNCDTSVIRDLIVGSDTNEITYMQDNLESWICASPPEFRGRAMWTIAETEKYCQINDTHCPSLCSCFKRIGQKSIIVDCRSTVLKHMPEQLPNSQLELWFQNSNISEISPLPYLENVTVLNLSNNTLRNFDPQVIYKLRRLTVLHLRSNHLTGIPFQVRSLMLSKLTLSGNPFICDCTTSWMKRWLLEEENIVPDWTKVKCLDNFGNLQQLIAVPDSNFICKDDNNFSVSEHVFLPSVTVGSILLVVIVLSLMIYFQRFNLKVLLFIHCNFHPFDKQAEKQKDIVFDAVTIYTEGDHELNVKLSNHLLEKGYKIADMYKNSYIGYTYIENVEKLINCSNKIIIIMTKYGLHDKIIQAAWNIAYDRAMSTSLNSIILVMDRLTKKQQKDLDITLIQFLKSNNFLDRESKLLKEKIEYLLPKAKSANNHEIELDYHQNNKASDSDDSMDIRHQIQISYPDEHHFFVKNEIFPFMSSHTLQPKILDMEFTPGADIRDELPTILDASRHLIFIFTENSLVDDVRMYILSQALTKTLLEDHNYLLLCTSGRICLEHVPKDVSKYVENYVTISINDPQFKNRLLQSILHNCKAKCDEQNVLENEPLLQ